MMQNFPQPNAAMHSLPQSNARKNPLWPVIWQGLVRLDFISNGFTWLMELLARITEPMASLSAIYIIIVAGVPALLNVPLYTLALALIIGSPELLVVGAFKIASRELAQGNKKAWWLMASCCTLLILTALTVSDLFMWHWSPAAVNVLMGFRCLAGIAYTFTRGVVTDNAHEVPVSQGSPVHRLLEQFTASVLEDAHRTRQQILAEIHKALQEANWQQQQQIAALKNSLSRDAEGIIARALQTLQQQNHSFLGEMAEQLERANSRRLEAVVTKLEQVKITLESNPSLPTVRPARPQFRRLLGQSPSIPLSEVRPSQVDVDGRTSDSADWQQVIADKLQEIPGATSQQMADAVGCSRSTAGKWLKVLREEGVLVNARAN